MSITRDLDRQISEIRTRLEVRDLHHLYALRSIEQSIGQILRRLDRIERGLDKPTTGARLTGQVKALWDQTWMKGVVVLLLLSGNQKAAEALLSMVKAFGG